MTPAIIWRCSDLILEYSLVWIYWIYVCLPAKWKKNSWFAVFSLFSYQDGEIPSYCNLLIYKMHGSPPSLNTSCHKGCLVNFFSVNLILVRSFCLIQQALPPQACRPWSSVSHQGAAQVWLLNPASRHCKWLWPQSWSTTFEKCLDQSSPSTSGVWPLTFCLCTCCAIERHFRYFLAKQRQAFKPAICFMTLGMVTPHPLWLFFSAEINVGILSIPNAL